MIDQAAEAQQQIQQVADALAGPDQPGETYLGKLGRLTAAQHAATELVMGEMLEQPDPMDVSYPQSPPETPADQELREAITEFAEALTELNNQRSQANQAAMPILPARPNLT